MKKTLCLVMTFAICFSMSAIAETSEEAVSNIVTYGPVSLDISDQWEEIGYYTEPHWIGVGFKSTSKSVSTISLTIQDIWNGLMPDETRQQYISSGITQEDFDSLDMATQYMTDRAEELGINPDEIESMSINGYKFCRLVIPLPQSLSRINVFNTPEYYAVVNGYMVQICYFNSIYSDGHDDLMKTLESLKIGIIDTITGK